MTLSPAQVRSIRAYRTEHTPAQLASMFRVHIDTVRNVLKGRTWKGVK